MHLQCVTHVRHITIVSTLLLQSLLYWKVSRNCNYASHVIRMQYIAKIALYLHDVELPEPLCFVLSMSSEPHVLVHGLSHLHCPHCQEGRNVTAAID